MGYANCTLLYNERDVVFTNVWIVALLYRRIQTNQTVAAFYATKSTIRANAFFYNKLCHNFLAKAPSSKIALPAGAVPRIQRYTLESIPFNPSRSKEFYNLVRPRGGNKLPHS